MKYNMKTWLAEMKTAEKKKPMPLLSFPCVSLLGVTVRELISDSQLQAKGMKTVADRTDAAASVSFMDLSVEAECFGAEVCVFDDEVPSVKGRIINDMDEAEALEVPAVGSGRTQIYIDAIRKATEMITDRPILAGIIGPYSLAARLFDVSEIMMDCYDDPEMVHLVLDKVTTFLIAYAKAFKEAGANGVVMAEPVAGLLSPTLEKEFSSPYVKRIVDAVQEEDFAVIYHNCGDNVPVMLESILSTGAAAYHFGNAVDMERDIIAKVPADTIVMGNVDPAGVLRMGNPERVKEATCALLDKCARHPNFVLSSGCDIPPMTPWENLDAFFETAESYGNNGNLFEELIAIPLAHGAFKANIIETGLVETDRSFRDMCASNSCGVYGKCYMCPPDVGEIDALMAEVKKYDYMLVYQTVSELEDSFDFEGMVAAKKRSYPLAQAVRKAFEEKKIRKALHLGAGGCGVCETCGKKTGEPCRFPELAMASLEAYGIHVSKLAKAADMKYINGQNTVTYFGGVLFSLDGEEK